MNDTTQTKSATVKSALQGYAARNGLSVSREYEQGRACVMRRKGRFIVEVTGRASWGDGSAVGFMYPAGVTGLSECDVIAWLEAH